MRYDNKRGIMSDQWTIQGKEFGNCNCDYGCPCQFSAPTTYGSCKGCISVQIDEGQFNETSLDGLSFVLLFQWPGEIKDGDGQGQLIIDERADEGQRKALETIGHGGAIASGTSHFFVYNSMMSKVHETLFKQISMSIDVDARRGNTTIDGLVESVGSPLINPFSGEEDRKGIHLPGGFEYTYAEMGTASSKLTSAIELELTDSYGQFNILHMNQDGVIR